MTGISASATWSAAVFAHNEASNIIDCLDSVLAQDDDRGLAVTVIANGCSDGTERIVEEYAGRHSRVHLVSLPRADKASAWNHYIHKVAHQYAPDADVHFFLDGDVKIRPASFAQLAECLASEPSAMAAGAMPASGRTIVAWSRRMKRMGRLAGGLYALRSELLDPVVEHGVRMPAGLIGDDLFVSCLAKDRLDSKGLYRANPRLVIVRGARFEFESLSPYNPLHWRIYWNRMIRYHQREHQMRMLIHIMRAKGWDALPADVNEVYNRAASLARYQWRGGSTLFDWLAVRRIRQEIGKPFRD